jgi:transcriptional regulator with GAF, ATPase, and Fis domain
LLSSKPIIGESEKIKELKNLILKCSQSSAPVLIFGASGVGKELVALHIHYSSSRKFETFMPINCGSIPNELVESELFGYEKGAFTGAVKEKKGLFEQADGGTIFLDEIGDLPLSAQVKLLRFLQEGEIEKIGRSQKIKINARIIAATNKNLQEEISAKKFREDLFYRLSVFPVYVPSMKERKEDIPILFDYFLNSFALENNLPVPKIEDEAMRIFIEYEWRGNVRELRNVANRILFLQKNIITKEIAQKALNFLNYNFLSENKTEEDILSKFANFKEIIPLKDFEMSLRKKYFEYVRSNSSSDAEAAKKLGLAPPNFHRMLKELGLK